MKNNIKKIGKAGAIHRAVDVHVSIHTKVLTTVLTDILGNHIEVFTHVHGAVTVHVAVMILKYSPRYVICIFYSISQR